MDDCPGVSFTTDLWTSRNQDPYLCVTMHYITKSWQMIRLMIHCGPAEGRHTAQAVAGHLDRVIGELKSIPEECQRACTSDNASNMLAAIPALTNEINVGMGCIDHLLNLVVNKSLGEDDEIKEAVDSFRNLSAKTHKSSLFYQRIRRECEKLNKNESIESHVQFCKIIAPVETRWHSTMMMIKSIIQLRPALEAIKMDRPQKGDKTIGTDPKFQAVIPPHEHFDILEGILKPLEHIAKMSEELSSESTPTICLVVPRLYNIINSLTGIRVKDPNPSSKAFATILLKNLEARFPNCGSQNYFYAAANILHPYYQGVVLLDLNTRESTMNTFLKENEVLMI